MIRLQRSIGYNGLVLSSTREQKGKVIKLKTNKNVAGRKGQKKLPKSREYKFIELSDYKLERIGDTIYVDKNQ